MVTWLFRNFLVAQLIQNLKEIFFSRSLILYHHTWANYSKWPIFWRSLLSMIPGTNLVKANSLLCPSKSSQILKIIKKFNSLKLLDTRSLKVGIQSYNKRWSLEFLRDKMATSIKKYWFLMRRNLQPWKEHQLSKKKSSNRFFLLWMVMKKTTQSTGIIRHSR